MNGALERAIRDLEHSTTALLSTEFSDLLALSRALDKRADAITKVALLAEEGSSEASGAAVERLANALVEGEEMTRRMLQLRRETNEERVRIARISESIEREEQGRSQNVDYAG